jgi:hypothetical protein
MSEVWDYQIRATISDSAAALVREAREAPELAPLTAAADRHKAIIVSQYEAFAHYVAGAERNGEQDYPLYKWTKATIEDPIKAAKHKKIVTFYVGGEEVCPKDAAEALEADLLPLVGGGVVEGVNKYDTNPANNPQPPAHFQT